MSNLKSLRFQSIISHEGAELGHILLLNIIRKAYKGSPLTLSHLNLSDLERSKSRTLKFRSIISRKGAVVGHMLQLDINRKAFWGVMVCLHFTLVTLNDQCQGHSDFGRPISHEFFYISLQ